MAAAPTGFLDASVVICAYTEQRWDQLGEAVASVLAQEPAPHEVIVVIDHNDALLARCLDQFVDPHVQVVPNSLESGLSGARNVGVRCASAPIVAFLDDDAVAEPGWLASLLGGFAEPDVIAAGGTVEPWWQAARPDWLPEEYLWVVGCSYRGLPESVGPVRNPIGASMAFRSAVFERAGGFRSDLGRVGKHPLGCEETELCIRAAKVWPGASVLFIPHARVRHRVPSSRATFRYFRARCYAEGLSKATVTRLVGPARGLEAERTYVFRVVFGALSRLLQFGRARGSRAQGGVALVGLVWATVGYIVGNLSWRPLATTNTTTTNTTTSEPVPREHGPAGAGGTGSLEWGTPPPGDDAVDEDGGPVQLGVLELEQPVGSLRLRPIESGAVARRARICGRLHGHALGEVMVDLVDVAPGDIEATVRVQLGSAAAAHVRTHHPESQADANGTADQPDCWPSYRSEEPAPRVSVVIATLDRVAELERCLDSLAACDWPDLEIIVVHNGPRGAEPTRELIERWQAAHPESALRYLDEVRQGACRARNAGWRAATGPIVAFTDDDVVVDVRWPRALVEGFADGADVGCVTGLVVPARLDTRTEQLFERHGGFGKGYEPRRFDRRYGGDGNLLHPYAPGSFGVGNNMALTKRCLHTTGGFCEALGPGTRCHAGEDLDLYISVILSGAAIVYTPKAIVHHYHRCDPDALERQMEEYGVGLGAMVTRQVLRGPRHVASMAMRAPLGLRRLVEVASVRPTDATNEATPFPALLIRAERRGLARGPASYVRQAAER